MRTLSEILEAIKSGEKPGYEECYWAVLALDSLNHFNFVALERLSEYKKGPFGPGFEFQESFNREKAALDKSPREWVGWTYDPSNPDYQQSRRAALSVFETVANRATQDNG